MEKINKFKILVSEYLEYSEELRNLIFSWSLDDVCVRACRSVLQLFKPL